MKINYKLLFTILISIACGLSLFAQPFSIDNTFESTYVFRNFTFENRAGSIVTVIELPDGSLRISGAFQDPYDSYYIGNNIKLSLNGEFDSVYGFPTDEQGYYIDYYHPYIYMELGGLSKGKFSIIIYRFGF